MGNISKWYKHFIISYKTKNIDIVTVNCSTFKLVNYLFSFVTNDLTDLGKTVVSCKTKQNKTMETRELQR